MAEQTGKEAGGTFPAVRRGEAHLSREPSKEAVAILGGMLGAGSAGVGETI
jgi:hypothetical protein